MGGNHTNYCNLDSVFTSGYEYLFISHCVGNCGMCIWLSSYDCIYKTTVETNCSMRDRQQNYTKNVIIFVARDSTMIVLFPSLTRSITNLLVVMYACDSVTATKRNSSENLKMMKYEEQKH